MSRRENTSEFAPQAKAIIYAIIGFSFGLCVTLTLAWWLYNLI